MKKQIRALLEIGIIYAAVSIVLDYLLAGFQILLWPALAVAFILFAVMMFAVVWEQRAPSTASSVEPSPSNESDLILLEHLCSAAIDQGDAKAGETVSERIRSIAYAAAALRLNEPETTLRNMAEREPNLLRLRVGDEEFFQALTMNGAITRKGDWQSLDEYLRRVEEWAK